MYLHYGNIANIQTLQRPKSRINTDNVYVVEHYLYFILNDAVVGCQVLRQFWKHYKLGLRSKRPLKCTIQLHTKNNLDPIKRYR
jgi:hypothetical protein